MTLSQFFTVFIFIHAVSGMISLVTGTISVITKKGGKLHKKSGKIFYYSMLVAGGSGIGASVIPGHYNPFLFVVGLFSLYLVISGYRALKYTRIKDKSQLRPDSIIAKTMIVIAILMVFFGSYIAITTNRIGIVLIVFGIIAFLNGFNDLKAFKDISTLKKKAVRLHIGKISGGYIAAFTAFLVTNAVLPSLFNWLLPTLFGTIFITYWQRKMKTKKRQS